MSYINNLGFLDFEVLENGIYFCDVFTGNIIKLDLLNSQFSIICKADFYNNKGGTKMQYGIVKLINEKLFFVPRNATSILILDIKTREIKAIKLQKEQFEYKPLFVDMYIYEDSLYLIPGRYKYIVEINVNSLKQEYYLVNRRENELFTNSNIVSKGDNNIIIFKNDKTGIIQFDLKSKKSTYIKIDFAKLNILTAIDFKGKIWVAGFGGEIISIDKINFKQEYINDYVDCSSPIQGIGQLLNYKDDIYFIAINQPIIYKLLIKEKKIIKYIEYDWLETNKEIWKQFTKCDILGAKVYNDRILMYSTMRKCIIEVNLTKKHIKYYEKFKWQKENMNYYLKESINKKNMIQERNIDLNEYLEYLSN